MAFLLAGIFLFSGFPSPGEAGEVELVPLESTWKYLDNGTDQGTAWRSPGFNDGAWASGPAEFGYGEGDEATVVSFGPNSKAKYTTTYFRHPFTIPDASILTDLKMRLLRDDGAVVYLNGVEQVRANMPAGPITYTTFSASAAGNSTENRLYSFELDAGWLVNGLNVLAVEVHQASLTDGDLGFDLELTALQGLSLRRGPYLQRGSPTGMVVRWRTNFPSDSQVQYGTNPASLTSAQYLPAQTFEHEVTLSGLSPDTRYYYMVGSSGENLTPVGIDHSFVTPPAGTGRPTRIWVLGDSGTADAVAAAVRDAYLAHQPARPTDAILMLGDDAYPNGTDAEFTRAVFQTYPTLLRQSPVWSAYGNHDSVSADSSTQTGPYYEAFTFPRNGEAGGLASGTEAYYSFNYGNIHFICLNSTEAPRSFGGPMMTWLRNDIAANTLPWTIAFWHHPPYSKGGVNSDTGIWADMRRNALPSLEAAGVDLVLSGDSHTYQRSFLIDGHYGTSDTFNATMLKDGGDGRIDGTGAYQKSAGPSSHEGTVYVVCGSSGSASKTVGVHPVMYTALTIKGSLVLDLDGGRLDAAFLDETGVVRDYFTILKGGAGTPPADPSDLAATAISFDQIDLVWSDNSSDEAGFKVERSTDGSSFTQIAQVGAGAIAYSDQVVSPSSTYFYRVHAFNAAGSSGHSNTASATTPAAPPPPAPPSGLSATAVSSGRIDLAWSDNSSDEAGFKVERSTDGASFTQIASLAAGAIAHSDLTVLASTLYFYRVRAHNAFGDSDYSNTASATTPGAPPPPAPPSGLTATAVSSGRIDLAWSDNSSDEAGFKVERSTDGASFTQIASLAAGAIAHSDLTVLASTLYFYRVRAHNASGDSAYSNTASATTPAGSQTVTLIATGSVWKYLDNGSNQGTAWRAPAFDDSSWASGPAELGYGDGDEATVVSFGPSATNKYTTTYFRHAFNVAGAAGFTGLTLGIRRDDGAIVYLNGVEVFRTNMPAGTVTHTTLATSSNTSATTFFESPVSPSLLAEGVNVLAVEIHQATINSSDISFNLRLIGSR